MNYKEALAYLDTFINYERTPPNIERKGSFDLSRVVELADRLDHPQRAYPVLHVAGTKGKGSTCSIADAILRAAGLKVGLYTSPHLIDLRERIKVGGEMIPEARFAEWMRHCRPALEIMRKASEGIRKPTYFEVLTHLAFLYFQACEVDVAVVEVGLGGRLDATNICNPAVCAITHISLDHTAILGDSLRAIAREKAGILKPGVPAVVGPQNSEALEAIVEVAGEVGAPLETAGRDFQAILDEGREPIKGNVPVRLSGNQKEIHCRAQLGIQGRFQIDNWGVAVRMVQKFYRQEFERSISPTIVDSGSREVRWPGRMEEVPLAPGSPRLVLDGAHNGASLQVIVDELREWCPQGAPLVVLFGCAEDKDRGAMLDVLEKRADRVIFTQSQSVRACQAGKLKEEWERRSGRDALSIEDPRQGLEEALNLASPGRGPTGLVLVTGSIYLVGWLKEDFLKAPLF